MKPENIPFMKKSCIYILSSLLLASTGAIAQTGDKVNNLGNEDITIVKDYQPVLNDAFKINILPETDTTVSIAPLLNYQAEPKQMNTPFNITPIKPVKIKDDAIKKLYRGFVKAGYGNYNTPLAELRFNSLRSKQFEAGVQARHLSSSGAIDGYGHPDFSENNLGVNATRFFDKNALTGELAFDRDVFHYYGYKSPPEMFTKNETRHLMNLFEGKFGFNSTHTDKDKLSYHSSIAFNGFSDNFSSDESLIDLKADGGKRYKDSYISAGFELAAMHVKQPLQDNQRSILKIEPRYAFKKNQFYITTGVNLAYENGDYIDSELHLYPHARLQVELLSEQLSVFGELTGNLNKNTLVDFSRENKFLDNFVPLQNTNNKLNLSGGFNVKLSREVIAVASATIGRVTDQAFFANLPADDEPVKYSVAYDDANVMALHAGVDYAQGEKTGFGFQIDYTSYNTEELDKPLFKPAFRVGINGRYSLVDKIYLKSELYYVDGVYAINYDTPTPGYQKLKSYIDINLGVEYRYSKILSAFVQLNNLGMQKYFRWYNYPSYRLNAMAGVTYSFW